MKNCDQRLVKEVSKQGCGPRDEKHVTGGANKSTSKILENKGGNGLR